ncbi:multicopper oxidase-domain-containing protein [Biscogniauxia sp. FL1348]|nr:multicopper oxidase-domain-containing protein [Biscogniauxia sp. FL1348]
MDLIRTCSDLAGSLSYTAQNGKSLWGTLSASYLPLWILGQGGYFGGLPPWGNNPASILNPLENDSLDVFTRKYEFNISRGMIAPDGYEKSVILVNGQYPGPLIEANWGDYIEVTVNNHIEEGYAQGPAEGTAIHWHGFHQTGTPWMDGVPGVSQCPIAPGKSFTYKFRAEVYGTSWYHSHYSAQYSGGLYGPIVVYGPSSMSYDLDIGPIMVNDWWHQDYFAVVEEVMSPNFTGHTLSNNNLINGRMHFDCSNVDPGDTAKCTSNAGLSKFRFQSGKTHRLRFINSGSEGTQRISIDGHNMTVIANDFTPLVPYETQVVTLGVGQRVDVVVRAHADDPGATFWLRANLTSCSSARQPDALAAIYYEGADADAVVPASAPWDVRDPGDCANDDLARTKPHAAAALPEPSWTQNMDVGLFQNASGHRLWKFGGVTARVDYNDPSLLRVARGGAGDLAFAPEMNVVDYGTNSSIRFIVNNPTPAAHPMHAHGLSMYILAQGVGNYNGSTLTAANLANPLRRDVQMVGAFSHVVVQLDARNPGLWPFHCHVAWHASAGFFSQMLFRPDDLVARYPVPPETARVCADWAAFTERQAPDQIDSGL